MFVRSRAGKIAAGVMSGIAAVAVLAGCSTEDSDAKVVDSTSAADAAEAKTATEAKAVVGQTQEISTGGKKLNVTVADLVPATASPYAMPVKGSLYQVTVTIQGVEGTMPVNPMYVSARAADGTSYDSALGTVDGQLDSTDVSAGDTIKGNVAFDVTGAPIASIRYEGPLGDQLASWSVQ